MSENTKFSSRALSAAGLTLALASIAALPQQALAHEGHAEQASSSTTASNMVVVRDASTGQLRAATAAELSTLQQSRSGKAAATRGVQAQNLQKQHVSGARGVRVTDEMMSMSIAVRKPDGSIGQQCFDSEEEAKAALATAGKTAANKLETE